jgi:hypothetical protein
VLNDLYLSKIRLDYFCILDDIYLDLIMLVRVPDGGRDGHVDGRVVPPIAVLVLSAGQLRGRIAQHWLLLSLV